MFDEYLNYFIPDRRFDSSIEAVESLNDEFEGIILDLDGVLMEVNGDHPSPNSSNIREKMDESLKELKRNYNTCLMTNRVRFEDFDSENIEDFFDIKVIESDGTKPSEDYFRKALDFLEVDSPSKAVMIGDSPYTDVFGANRVGITTYQVEQDRSNYNFPLNFTKRGEDYFQKAVSSLERLI